MARTGHSLRVPTFRLRGGVLWCVAGASLLAWAVGDGPALAALVAAEAPALAGWPWWSYPLALFALTAAIGVLAVLAGIGGSVLFVPVATTLLPSLHLDFVRGAGLLLALTGALSAGPGLIRSGLVQVRLALAVSVAASVGAIAGARVGLALPAQQVQLALGVLILCAAGAMVVLRPHDDHAPPRPSRGLARLLGLEGGVRPGRAGGTWRPRRLGPALVLFLGIGFMAGMFGIGGGWANVPVLNLVMGVPLRLAVATSYFLLAIVDTAAALIYLHRGALLPLLVVPSVLGIMLGARGGALLLARARTAVLRRIVITVLVLAGLRALLKGLGV